MQGIDYLPSARRTFSTKNVSQAVSRRFLAAGHHSGLLASNKGGRVFSDPLFVCTPSFICASTAHDDCGSWIVIHEK